MANIFIIITPINILHHLYRNIIERYDCLEFVHNWLQNQFNFYFKFPFISHNVILDPSYNMKTIFSCRVNSIFSVQSVFKFDKLPSFIRSLTFYIVNSHPPIETPLVSKDALQLVSKFFHLLCCSCKVFHNFITVCASSSLAPVFTLWHRCSFPWDCWNLDIKASFQLWYNTNRLGETLFLCWI